MPIRKVVSGRQVRVGTSYTASFPDFPSFSLTPTSIELHQAMKSHDIMTLKYKVVSPFFLKALKTGTPVKVTWINGNNSKGNFSGFVSKVRKIKEGNVRDEGLEITCVAASFPLKNTETKVWVNKTASEVVKDIAKRNKMKAVVSPHPARFSQLAMHGVSWWEYINELAMKVGYAAWVDGTTLYFKSIDDTINKPMGSVPVLAFENESFPPFSAAIERTLDSFEIISGDYIEDDDEPRRSTKNINGVDPITGKSYSASVKPTSKKAIRKNNAQVLFQDNRSLDVAVSKDFAKKIATGKAETTRLHVPGKFFSQGDARIRPFGLVQIRGIDNITDGYWVVKSVIHTMNNTGVYTCSGTVVSDGRGANIGSKTRRKSSGEIPSLNLTNYGDGDSLSLPKAPALASKTVMFNRNNSGYTLNPRSWK
jgi:phage protein D